MRAVHLTIAILILGLALLAGGAWGGVPGLLAGALAGMLLVAPVALHYRHALHRQAADRRATLFRRQVFRELEAAERVGRPHPRAPWLRVVPDEVSVNLGDVLERLERRGRADVEDAVAEAEALRARHPTSPAVQALLARLYLRDGRRDAALAASSQAIRLAMRHGDLPEAVEAYQACAVWRDELDLDARSLETLGRLLARRGDADGARWCLDRVGPQGSPGRPSA